MVEGDQPGGDPGGREHDILAQRRARREQGDAALARRAQDAEATVRTLEAHIAELRGRLREAEEEQRRTAEQLAEREHEVRRVKQREYAEQQLRVEAEEQRERLEREQRAEVDRLQRRLSAGERHARELTDRLESLRRELAEAEQAASAERAAVRRTERELSEREATLEGRELALERTRAEIEARLSEARTAELKARESQVRDEQQLQTLTARLAALEAHAAELQLEMDAQREARTQSERELELMRQGHARMELIVTELKGIAQQLRSGIGSAAPAPAGTSAAAAAGAGTLATGAYVPGPEAGAEGTGARVTEASIGEQDRTREEEEEHRLEMARALAAAVERLRARVTAVDELQRESDAESERSAEPEASTAPKLTPFLPPVPAFPTHKQAWLAPAIRRVAERHDAKLAAELVCELLSAQGPLLKRALTYTLRIEGWGDVHVQLQDGRATVRRLSAAGIAAGAGAAKDPPARERGAFLLEGPAAAFAELAAGGAGRRLEGVRVRGSRRRARRLLAARRAPLELSDLAEADVRVWPGLLLLALAEAIPPEWTVGHGFVLAFAIESPPASASVTIYAQVRDGAPLAVTRVRGERPLSTVRLSERAFQCMFAGAPLPLGEQVLVEGSTEPLRLLLGWSDRIQGLAR
jgi:hypothetical protein